MQTGADRKVVSVLVTMGGKWVLRLFNRLCGENTARDQNSPEMSLFHKRKLRFERGATCPKPYVQSVAPLPQGPGYKTRWQRYPEQGPEWWGSNEALSPHQARKGEVDGAAQSWPKSP